MNKRPLLITDIDGTLLNEYGQLPPANVRALQRWVDQGKILALATGRNLRITKPIAQVINRELFLILQDGGLIMHYPSRQVLQYHNLNYRAAWSAYDVFEKEDLSVMIFDPLPHGQKFTLWQNGSLSAGLSAYLQGHKPERICGQEGKHRAILGPSKIVTIDTQTTTEAVYHLLKTSLFEARVIRTEAVRLNAWFVEVAGLFSSKNAC
jgi:hydroxymethylpyrimidine pyrophosphatase-like HAD family hydrolase